MSAVQKVLALLLVVILMTAGCNSSHEMQPGLSDAVRDYSDTLRVIPDIEGFGVDTTAGRGGRILRVTTLKASGEGSLRAALEALEPRVVIFEVGGVIDLTKALSVTTPHITVAGETAPSPGITIIGAGLAIRTHDVLIRHLRFRVGDRPEGPSPTARDGISVGEGSPPGTYNVVVDHCSVAWAVDEGMSNWGDNISDITFSRCIIAENLSHSLHPKKEHSKGLLIGDNGHRIAAVGNLFAHNMNRNPFVKGNVSALIANNVIYNPGTGAIHFGDREHSGPSLGTVIGNVLLPGPDTPRLLPLVRLQLDGNSQTRVYALNNDAGGRRALMRTLWAFNSWQPITTYDASPVRIRPLTQRTPDATIEWVLRSAGARPLDRDAVDKRIVETLRNGSGRIIDSVNEVGGFPEETSSERPLTLPDTPHATVENGYTHLENWLREFALAVE